MARSTDGSRVSRPRYQSDEARLKTPPHVRVLLSIENDPKYAEALTHLETRAIWLGGNILNLLYDDNPQHFTATVLEEFDACGPPALKETLHNVPIQLVRSPDSDLRGAAVLARERM